MSVHIVTTANKSGGYYEILKESCIRNGCKLTTLGFGNMNNYKNFLNR